ncbi:MAG: long-chain-fatty-acid--CoA ligase [Candidatus Aminicenantes bacterium]|nr:long-chain-fatty-acid--CoA ligase [Candidatus Aminicenantes bacterium]
MGLYEILEKTAKNAPNKHAVICGDQQYSHKQLKERADSLSSSLEALDIQKDDKIGIIHRNCHRYLETYYAAAKIGATLVPINYRLGAKDFVYILNDSLAKVLIAQPDLVSCLEEKKDALPLLKYIILTESEQNCVWPVFFDFESLIQEAEPGEKELCTVDESDIAQIYYTSGTTGRPKGVILTHKNNSTYAEGTIRELKLSASDRWLHVSPLFHLADAWAVWAITKMAATHVMIPAFEPKSVLKAIENQKVTLSNFIPTMVNLMVNHTEVEKYDFSSLRLIMTGGAPIAKEVVRKVLEVFGCAYIQTYGLTETSPFLTMSILKEGMKSLPFEERLNVMTTTGRPFDRVQLKVVKENGEEILPDEKDVGEIIAKGETITPGYWALPEETGQRIVDGWLHTRDLAVVNPEGYVTIVDRMDDVIITGGENVYSIEVEDVLYSHPNVLEAAVIGLPDPVWGEKVTAVVVAKKGENFVEEDVIRFCRANMAPFKAPKKLIITDHLPKTGSAKICKFKLREKYGKSNKSFERE